MVPGVFCYDVEFKHVIIAKILKQWHRLKQRPQEYKQLTGDQLLATEQVQPWQLGKDCSKYNKNKAKQQCKGEKKPKPNQKGTVKQ